MKKRFYFLSVVIFAPFCIFSAYAVTLGPNYTFNESTVDNGEIRWGGTTKYNTQWVSSVSTWNARGKVSILADTASTIEDLTLVDLYSTTNGYFGMMDVGSIGSDELYLNKYYLDGSSSQGLFSSSEKQKTITHELGHALGLAHSSTGNVMKQGKLPTISLGTQDKSSYTTKWGN